MRSKIGLILAGIYILIAIYLIATQGLFGESFIALVLGMPWVLIPAYFEFWHVSESVSAALLIIPMAINAIILYWIGSLFERSR